MSLLYAHSNQVHCTAYKILIHVSDGRATEWKSTRVYIIYGCIKSFILRILDREYVYSTSFHAPLWIFKYDYRMGGKTIWQRIYFGGLAIGDGGAPNLITARGGYLRSVT